MKANTTPPPAPRTVENFNVTVPWVRIALPLKKAPHAFLEARKPLVRQLLGRDVHTAAIPCRWRALAGHRDRALELLLLRAEIQLAPAASRPRRHLLHLEMTAHQWGEIVELAAFYHTDPFTMTRSLLIKRMDGLRDFDRAQLAGALDIDPQDWIQGGRGHLAQRIAPAHRRVAMDARRDA